MGDGGDFGDWSADADDLPCFELRGEAVAGDVWHQVGNDRITATAHADGATTLYWAEEGLVRVGRSMRLGAPAALAARFGCGYASWRHRAGALTVERRVWAPFGEVPALRIDVALEGVLPAAWAETWHFAPYPFLPGGLMSRRVAAPRSATLGERVLWHAMLTASSASRALTEALRRALGWRLRLRGRFDPALRAHGSPLRSASRRLPRCRSCSRRYAQRCRARALLRGAGPGSSNFPVPRLSSARAPGTPRSYAARRCATPSSEAATCPRVALTVTCTACRERRAITRSVRCHSHSSIRTARANCCGSRCGWCAPTARFTMPTWAPADRPRRVYTRRRRTCRSSCCGRSPITCGRRGIEPSPGKRRPRSRGPGAGCATASASARTASCASAAGTGTIRSRRS